MVDTADWAEKLCIKAICDQHQKRGIESFDYGKGYTFVYEGFGELLNLLADVTERGIHVVLTAHAATKRREQPDEFGTYDCWGLKLIDSPKCSIANMVKEWADVLLFANYKTLVVAVDDKGKKHKAQGGSRVMYTSHHPCWDAKNRLGMPEELPLEWEALARYIEAPNAPNPPPPAPTPPAPPTPPPASVPTDVPTAAPSSTAAADPQPSAPQPPAQESPAPSPAQPPERPDNQAALAALRDLMKANGVEDFQVQAAFAARGYFPEETPLENLPADFINGVLVGAWKQVYGWIQANQPLPF